MRVPTPSRRLFLISTLGGALAPLSLAHTQIKTIARDNPLALSGNRFQQGTETFEIIDTISPDEHALLPNARQFHNQARRALQEMLDRQSYIIEHTGISHRWGHKFVRLKAAQKDSIDPDEQLVRQGAIRVFPYGKDSAHVAKLFHNETIARNESNGLWASRWYRIRNANVLNDARDSIGAVHIFEGNIQKVGQFGGRRFLNFGENYKTDITATIDGRHARHWERNGLDIAAMEGKQVQFRGFVEWINGPSIRLRHRLALHILSK